MPKMSKAATPAPVEEQAEAVERPIKHPEVKVKLLVGEKGLDAETAKGLLEWEEEGETKFKDDFLLKDVSGKKIRCNANRENRPLRSGNVDALKLEILNRRFRLNGESLVIGKTGEVLNAQHRLTALVMAEMERTIGKHAEHWQTVWPEPIRIDCLLVLGVDESDEVVSTMDTGVGRNVSDVLYRSEHFQSATPTIRKVLARMADYAVRILWQRTGAGDDAFSPRRTNTAAMDFIARHERLLECVKHIQEENVENRIGKYVSPGYAAGLMYLMAVSGGNEDKHDAYRGTTDEQPNESMLDFSAFDRAAEFWTLLGQETADLKAVREALADLVSDEGEGSRRAEKTAVICKAWAVFGRKKFGDKMQPLNAAALKLNYTDRDGIKVLDDDATIGGIDLGEQREPLEEIPDPETVEERTAEIRAEKEPKPEPKKGKGKPAPAPVEYETTTNAEGDELVGVKTKPKKVKPAPVPVENRMVVNGAKPKGKTPPKTSPAPVEEQAAETATA